MVVAVDATRAARLSVAASHATDAEASVVVRTTIDSALASTPAGFDLCVLDLGDAGPFDSRTCVELIRALDGRPVVVVTPATNTSFAADVVCAGAREFVILDDDDAGKVAVAIRLALAQDAPGAMRPVAAAPSPRSGELEAASRELHDVFARILGLLELVAKETGTTVEQPDHVRELRDAASRGVEIAARLGSIPQHPAESGPGAGTSFEILLQRANETTGPDSTPGDVAVSPAAVATAAPHRTVLLVEDDEVLRTTYAELLTSQGWEVLGASDGLEALLQAGTHGGPIDLLVADILLPRMSGVELWRRLSRLRPEAKVVFMSGNLDQVRTLVGSGPDAPRLLGKPFTPIALLETVRAVLAGADDAGRRQVAAA